MKAATIIYTIRTWNPVSWAIRWALPVSRFKWARASHSMILDGDHVIHATMMHGVVREPLDQALRGQVVVARKDYEVPDIDGGQMWALSQVGKRYDFKGAFGVSLAPDREWLEDDCWFCHELCAAYLHACGRRVFDKCGHVTDSALLLISSASSAPRAPSA